MYRHDIYLRNGILPQEETLNKTIIRDVINPSKIVSFWHTNKIIVLEKSEETVMVIKPIELIYIENFHFKVQTEVP